MTLASSAPLGHAQQSVTTAAAFASVPPGATYVIVSAESAIRWRDDGTNPTAAIGMPIAAGGTTVYDGNLAAFKMISQSGTAVVNVAYYAGRRS